jgi:hypothetical protein
MSKIKSLLLCFGLMIVGETQSYNDGYYYRSDFDRKVDRFLLYTAGGCAALIVGTYLCCRESNGSIIARVHNFYAPVCHLASFNLDSVDSFVENVESTACTRDAIFRLNQCMSNRYASWVKPWDWSSCMQRAYEEIRTVSLFYGYIPLLQKTESLQGEDVLLFARETFAGLTVYPCIMCLNNLWESMEYARQNRKKFDSRLLPLLDQMLPSLVKAYNLLRSEKEFLEEVRAKKTHDLQNAQLCATLSRR